MSVNLYKNGSLIPIAGNGGGVEVDAELSAESENPVQNKAIDAKIKELESAIEQATAALNNLKQVAKTGSYNDLTDRPTIPTSLKNPQPLVFSGGSSVSYDGSEKQTVPIPTSLPASGGNADTVDNKHASDFVAKTGDTMTGNLMVNNGTATGNGFDNGYQGTFNAGMVKAGDKAELRTDVKGGNLRLTSPEGYDAVELDLFNGLFRMYQHRTKAWGTSNETGVKNILSFDFEKKVVNFNSIKGLTSDCTVTFTTGDTTDANATSWTEVPQLTSGLTHAVLMERISHMMKNVKYLKDSKIFRESINANTDLNDVLEPGKYIIGASNFATKEKHYPLKGNGGYIEISTNYIKTIVFQTYYAAPGTLDYVYVYCRHMYKNGDSIFWSKWTLQTPGGTEPIN